MRTQILFLLSLVGIISCSHNDEKEPRNFPPEFDVYEVDGFSDGESVKYFCLKNKVKVRDCATLAECEEGCVSGL